MVGWEHPAEYQMYDIELDTPISKTEGHYRFYKEGATFMLHIQNDIWRVGGNLKDVLNYLPKGTKIGKISWDSKLILKEKVARSFNKENIHILGDTAHIHSLLGGKGMNMCIEDSYIFAELLSQNKERHFEKIRRKKIQNTVGILDQLTEVVGGQHFLGNTLRSSMKPFAFLFPVFMPYMRKFLLGLK